jgi:hypothetical protein
MRAKTRTALVALLAGGAAVLAGSPASAATCTATDPVNCTPAPPAPVRDLASIRPCVVYSTAAGLVVVGDAVVPFATSVALHCEGNTPWGYLSFSSTTPGQVGAIAAHQGPVLPAAGQVTLCTSVAFTYSDGTSGSDGSC